ncbi:S8 family serine peptidase [Methanococcoides orientis]|uniref:S8 family serine peptidase n=1 Tax=Methanococcoides orientis TaxID=2822137 RepID=UPI001E643B66|nr:S8 family serine peptidase [Methanococcoides orientis]UGV41527.1 S8 family serine peptidase [Methanococcoides orientis]
MDLQNWKLTVLTVCLLVTGMVIPVSAFAPSINAQYDIYDELTVEMPDNELYVHDEIIVKFSPGVSEEKIANINARNGAKVKYTSQYAGFKVLKIPENRNAQKMAEMYSKNPNVEYAVPNAIMTAFAVNDPYYHYQWNLHSDYGINVEPAWEITTGEGVIVAVLDTGVAQNAPDLADTNFVSGYDFINGDNDPDDDQSHGTHVAGTIAQSTNNGIGVAGVAYDCSIMPVKVLGADGSGNLAQLVDGIYFATDNGADVISMSLGYPPRYYPGVALDNALEYADKQGVTIVAAAGNDGTRFVSYPAAYEKCIAVGATGYDGNLAPYSNYGPGLDVVAPGGNTGQDLNNDGYGDGILQNTFDPSTQIFSYYFFQGTSMATPHVSGVAALLISQGASNDEVRTALESTAMDLGKSGWDTAYGYGLIDAKAALDSLNSVPAENLAPTASINGPYSGVVGTQIQFSSSGSTDPDGTIDFYYWEFGDGNTSNSENPTNVYGSAGTFTVNLTVTDNNDAAGTDSTTVTVTTATEPPETGISIISVDPITRTAGKNTFVSAKAVVSVQPDLAGSMVSGYWTGATTDIDSGLTDGSGTLTFYSDEVKYKKGELTFTFTVDDSTLSTIYPQ